MTWYLAEYRDNFNFTWQYFSVMQVSNSPIMLTVRSSCTFSSPLLTTQRYFPLCSNFTCMMFSSWFLSLSFIVLSGSRGLPSYLSKIKFKLGVWNTLRYALYLNSSLYFQYKHTHTQDIWWLYVDTERPYSWSHFLSGMSYKDGTDPQQLRR